jgi:RsiW-degrading membrane proteinase PrsW (M82 family)
MFIAPLLQFAVCFLILRWLLKRKPGQPFSKKAIAKYLLLGALSVVVSLGLTFVLPIKRDTFFGMNPILSGFLTAFLTAALFEEGMKYLAFRLAIRNDREVTCWLDVIIAAIVVAAGFVLMEDLEFVVSGSGSIVRALIPAHLLFQGIMGYYYGKARVTGQSKYHALSIVVPILAHTLFDMFLIALMSIMGDPSTWSELTDETLAALPYYEYMMPLLACAIITIVGTFIALIVMLKKIDAWSKSGEKQEPLA